MHLKNSSCRSTHPRENSPRFKWNLSEDIEGVEESWKWVKHSREEKKNSARILCESKSSRDIFVIRLPTFIKIGTFFSCSALACLWFGLILHAIKRKNIPIPRTDFRPLERLLLTLKVYFFLQKQGWIAPNQSSNIYKKSPGQNFL